MSERKVIFRFWYGRLCRRCALLIGRSENRLRLLAVCRLSVRTRLCCSRLTELLNSGRLTILLSTGRLTILLGTGWLVTSL